jgi:signal transduction histidine kinase
VSGRADADPSGQGAQARSGPDPSHALAALNDALLDIASERATGSLLERLVETSRNLVGARYAALGIPDGEGGFSQFITVGMTSEQMEAIGPLPRVHGMLGAMLTETEPYRTPDITKDPRWRYWPPEHPDMRSFLGVPVLAEGQVIAAFYLTDKETTPGGPGGMGPPPPPRGPGGLSPPTPPGFGAEDEALIVALAGHAAVAIENARLWEQAREATLSEERARIARELHDAMSQNLFSLQLTAASAADAVATDPAATAEHVRTISQLTRDIQAELRALVVDLRPPQLEVEGLVGVLRKHVGLLSRAHRVPITADLDALDDIGPRTEQALLRIAQEALHNALRHAKADRVSLRLAGRRGGVELVITDDGVGFDPDDRALRASSLGIVSMRHRARSVGGRLVIDAAPGRGTSVRVTVENRRG